MSGMYRVIGILVILLSMFASGAMADGDIDHCVTNEGSNIRNLCGFRLSVRYCCYGSEWYACDNTAKYNWGENPGYHEWLEPGESTGMACDPEVAGWRWAGCRASAGSRELAPYGWDLNSTRGFQCTQDGASKAQSSRSRSSGGLAGRWIKYNKSAASLHDNLLRTCGHGTHNEFTESGGKIHTSVVSGGAVIHEDELVDWSVASVSSNRITFKDGWGDIWHYDRCR